MSTIGYAGDSDAERKKSALRIQSRRNRSGRWLVARARIGISGRFREVRGRRCDGANQLFINSSDFAQCPLRKERAARSGALALELGEIDDAGHFIGSEHPLHRCFDKFDRDVPRDLPPDIISREFLDSLPVSDTPTVLPNYENFLSKSKRTAGADLTNLTTFTFTRVMRRLSGDLRARFIYA